MGEKTGGGGEVDVFSEGANFWSKKNEKTSIALGCISRVFMMKKEIKRRSKSPSLDLIKYNLKLQNVVGTTWNIQDTRLGIDNISINRSISQ